MLYAFATGSLMAVVFITLFGFIGTYGNMVLLLLLLLSRPLPACLFC
jgi:hypothetical protein